MLLCPNCHALTENYRAKNIRKEVSEERKKKIIEAIVNDKVPNDINNML